MKIAKGILTVFFVCPECAETNLIYHADFFDTDTKKLLHAINKKCQHCRKVVRITRPIVGK